MVAAEGALPCTEHYSRRVMEGDRASEGPTSSLEALEGRQALAVTRPHYLGLS